MTFVDVTMTNDVATDGAAAATSGADRPFAAHASTVYAILG